MMGWVRLPSAAIQRFLAEMWTAWKSYPMLRNSASGSEIFDFQPDVGLKRSHTKPKIHGTAPTERHTTIPNDSGPISSCFDEDPELSNCEIAQPI